MLNQKLIRKTSIISTAVSALLMAGISAANAQDISEVRWKSADKVRAMYGEPQSVRGPIGTHASYQLWTYDGFMVAFANEKAFHLFGKANAENMELNEDRPEEQSN